MPCTDHAPTSFLLNASFTLRQRSRTLIAYLSDRDYYRNLLKLAIPVTLQQLIMSSLNMVGIVLIGQLGDTSIAAVGLANQVFFLFQLLLFGITSGSAMFTAQLWGKRDMSNIKRVLGLGLVLSQLAALAFLLITQLAPEFVLHIYSTDPAVIDLGKDYLSLFGWCFPFVAITFTYASVLRSTGNVRLPLVVSTSALSLNMLLSYLLIFGKLGLPELGVQGAALSGLIARVVEACAMLVGANLLHTPASGRIREIFSFDPAFVKKVMVPVLPVVVNEMLWSFGITAYNVAYARIGTESFAAMNIASSIDQVATVVFIGIANATAILVGNLIGANQEQKAQEYGGRSIAISVLGSLVIGTLIYISRDFVLSFYKVSPEVIHNAMGVLTVIAIFLWLRMTNLIIFVGILRSGGDTLFALALDGLIIWFVGVPLAFYGAFALHLPVYWVYALVMTEELTKAILGLWRFLTRKWIHHLAQRV
jgi:putative MATE family efflux protein